MLDAVVKSLFATAILSVACFAQQPVPLVSAPGQIAQVPSWDLQSTKNVSANLQQLSQPGYNSSSWYHTGPMATVMAGLLQNGVYDPDVLFYSTNLSEVDLSLFTVPWLYREDITLQPGAGSHFFLRTNGINSRADIWLNGVQVADSKTQVGAYGGHLYDITALAKASNALAIQAYPTDPLSDLAIGFVDWNPNPPDNETGLWRPVEVKQTGPVFVGVPRVLTDFKIFKAPGPSNTQVTVNFEVRNLENTQQTVTLNGTITDVTSGDRIPLSQQLKLPAGANKTATLVFQVKNPRIWWPKQWGEQPLYTAQVNASVGGVLSDVSETRTFGIRYVSHVVNSLNDTVFSVNGKQFQVVGAGYTSDIFLRWDEARFTSQMMLAQDMGLNTIRPEGKLEQPQMYEVLDRLGMMVMPGWECCDEWEGWVYNTDMVLPLWGPEDYVTANYSMRHEAAMLQSHPSVMAFLVGSDWWPNDTAAAIYDTALKDWDWQTPIFAVADKRGYPLEIGPSGMKMDGPYDWVPPNYWYDVKDDKQQTDAIGLKLGAAFGFASEIGAGVGTPELGSLKKFLSDDDLNDLWQAPNKGLYHMSTGDSEFYTRTIYNNALYARFGPPISLDDYLLKAQMQDYEATRAMFEAYTAMWNADRPATGVIYWMLTNAWPSLHWNQFDYYLHTGGSYFGSKAGVRMENIVYDYQSQSVYLINRNLDVPLKGARTIQIDLVNPDGSTIVQKNITAKSKALQSQNILSQVPNISDIKEAAFLRLILRNATDNNTISRNVYWLSSTPDIVAWNETSQWFDTPTSQYANYTSLLHMSSATVNTSMMSTDSGYTLTLVNESPFPAFFIRLNLVDDDGNDVVPVFWSDNYVTLFPAETMELTLGFQGQVQGSVVQMSGANIGARNLTLAEAKKGGGEGPSTSTTTSSGSAAQSSQSHNSAPRRGYVPSVGLLGVSVAAILVGYLVMGR